MPQQLRELPMIKFGEEEFYIDTKLNELRQKDAPHNRIFFNDMTEIFDDSSLLCYDKHTKNVYRYYDESKPLPEHILILRLPPIRFLDPVGLALWAKLEEDTFIRKGHKFFAVSDKKIKHHYSIKEPIERVLPTFGSYDENIRENKFNHNIHRKRR
ncbi:hypothetical protein A9P82_08035 [Arachidicoccus ginsenosidimutans]|uniref:hypothetical protein n=1 Tax=Arachidicoccus sp. BS20 TaxID=1850526 RepID=UPI0007F17F84|nr:hypothetical protein [Arachidicoccus sp. BS20]ANI89244.1 hypothetical protein A9P82_08035 [Arachidicoccus sp. BS20]